MTPEEQNLISGLFDRLAKADTSPKDPEAENLIRTQTAAHPSATYLLVQSVLVQEHALSNAQARIAALEQQLAAAQQKPASGGFLAGLFGHQNKPTPPPAQPSYGTPPPPPQQQPVYTQQYAPPPPYPTTMGMAPSGGGSFLQTALTTAAGVAGGEMLFRGIEGLLGHNAGPFGPSLGGGSGGFFPGGGIDENIREDSHNTEIINNYYGDPNQNVQGGGAVDPQADQDAYDEASDADFDQADTSSYDDSGSFDDSGDFDNTDF
jgi:uncharacterized protein